MRTLFRAIVLVAMVGMVHTTIKASTPYPNCGQCTDCTANDGTDYFSCTTIHDFDFVGWGCGSQWSQDAGDSLCADQGGASCWGGTEDMWMGGNDYCTQWVVSCTCRARCM